MGEYSNNNIPMGWWKILNFPPISFTSGDKLDTLPRIAPIFVANFQVNRRVFHFNRYRQTTTLVHGCFRAAKNKLFRIVCFKWYIHIAQLFKIAFRRTDTVGWTKFSYSFGNAYSILEAHLCGAISSKIQHNPVQNFVLSPMLLRYGRAPLLIHHVI